MSTEMSPDRSAIVDELVAAGCFTNRQQALDHAVDLLRDEAETLDAIRDGLASIERGEGTSLGDAARTLRAKYSIPEDA